MQLYLLSEPDAVCLDGSPAGYYYAPGSRGQWLLYLQGGGWCYTPAICAWRARLGEHGSSTRWSPYMDAEKIPGLSADPLVNPDFAGFSRVFVNYCDGASFAGDAVTTHADGFTTYSRGRRILEAVLRRLQSVEFGLGAVANTEFLLAGCSAGGLTVYRPICSQSLGLCCC